MKIEKIDSLTELEERAKDGTLKGLFEISEKLYFEGPGINRSMLADYFRNPAKCKAKMDDPKEQSRKKMHFIQGSILDKFLTENKRSLDSDLYVKGPDSRIDSKEWKEIKEKNPGKIPIKEKEWNEIRDWSMAVEKSKKAQQLIGHAEYQVTAFWYYHGILCKARADFINFEDKLIGDFKSTKDATPEKFKWSIRDFFYDWQAGFYMWGFGRYFEFKDFVFICIEKEKPYLLAFFSLKHADIMTALEEIFETLPKLDKSMKENDWPGYSEEVEVLEVPPRKKAEMELF